MKYVYWVLDKNGYTQIDSDDLGTACYRRHLSLSAGWPDVSPIEGVVVVAPNKEGE